MALALKASGAILLVPESVAEPGVSSRPAHFISQTVYSALFVSQAKENMADKPLSFVGIHAAFLADESEQIDFEGSRFSGKTWACCAKVIYSVQKYPGIIWQICRYSDEDTQKLLKPVFLAMCHRMGEYPDWDGDASSFVFANESVVRVKGLRSQGALSKMAKVRGLDVGSIWVDQAEEVPEDIGMELPFGTRQPDMPHQTVMSPNPPSEDNWIADFFPDDNSVTGRKYYGVALYDNPFCPSDKLAELERLYPPTHARYKTLVLGQRGPSAIGTPIYEGSFKREIHCAPVVYDPSLPLLEAFHMGQHHPVWLIGQRSYFGNLTILGGVMGKRLMLDEFLPIVDRYRAEWFPQQRDVLTCCDPPPTDRQLRFTNVSILQSALKRVPHWTENSNAPDVREAVIQSISGMMQRRFGMHEGFQVSNDADRWLMASRIVIKHSKFFVDGCEASYVWDEHAVSIGNKKHRQAKVDEWVDGAQRCLENLVLNFCATHETDEEKAKRLKEQAAMMYHSEALRDSPHGWLL